MQVEVLNSLRDVEASEWDALVGDHDPFVEHGFLLALEDSGSLDERTGWYPHHLVARTDEGVACAAMPLYLKDNSYGEYIFDWGWAEAAYAAGIPYYPKLVSAVPFTPATGRRILIAPEAESEAGKHHRGTGQGTS